MWRDSLRSPQETILVMLQSPAGFTCGAFLAKFMFEDKGTVLLSSNMNLRLTEYRAAG